MLLGDLLQVLCGLMASGAAYLIVSSLLSIEAGAGFALLVLAGLVGYVAEVHGGVELKKTEADDAESS